MGKPLYPSLYQINTRVWLHDLSRQMGRAANLDDIPDKALDHIAGLRFDWVYFLGVWQTGDAGRQVSLQNPQWLEEYKAQLPDFHEEDVSGSPFAIQKYELHVDLGSDKSLPRLRKRLQKRGLRLLLDFVPNHTALDHPWVGRSPAYYIQGTEADLARAPRNYWQLKKRNKSLILAHGRDPYFPGWPDTLQLNYRNPLLRKAVIREISNVAAQCDGVRCDMAMLLLPEVFAKTWGDASLPKDGKPPVDTPFWPEAITQVRKKYPQFQFMAEVYWDLEWALQQQGFDYTYDKRLYDRLVARDAGAVRGHLLADLDYQNKSVRFLENHDEPRAAAAFPEPIHQAAAAIAFFVPGLHFFQEGQFQGRRVKPSMHVGRRPEEPPNRSLQQFYNRLLECLQRPEVREGHWHLLECRTAWEGNATAQQFVAFTWEGQVGKRLLVAVNYGPARGQSRVPLPFDDLKGKSILLQNLMSPARYERSGDEMCSSGLYLDMPEWGYNIFEMTSL